MNMHLLSVPACCLGAWLLSHSALMFAAGPTDESELLRRARTIHQKALTIDTHVDIPGANYATPELDPGQPTRLKCDLPKMEAGYLDAVFLAVYVGQRPEWNAAGYQAAAGEASSKFDAISRLVAMYPQRTGLALTPQEVQRIQKTGRRVILIGVENGYPLGEDPANVGLFYSRGARYITLVHGSHNQLADSATQSEPQHQGLSELGKKVVGEMNRLSMMVDVSHASPKAFWDIIQLSRAPIIASHSGCAALAANPRNLDDEQLKALAKNRGVIQVVALAEYLKVSSPERQAALRQLREELGWERRGSQGGRGQGTAPAAAQTAEQRAEMEKRWALYQEKVKAIDARYPGATLKDFVDHIDHAVKVAGIDHVGIGTDFDGGGGIPGFNDHSQALNVTVELLRRGYSKKQIEKIWGGNFLRVWREVIQAARKR